MKTLRKDGYTVRVITDPHEARKFVSHLKRNKNGNPYALDFETTGLDPEYAQVRLTCISKKDNEAFVIDHFECGSFASFADDLAECGPWYVFNAGFEGDWFDYEAREAEPVKLYDVGHMRRSVLGGGPLSLATQCKRDLGIELDKSLQNSGWSNKVLTSKQYFYGGCDAIHTRALGKMWRKEMQPNHWKGFHVINNSWRAVNECQRTGLLIDVAYHKTLIAMWERRRHAAETAFRKYVPVEHLKNIRSKKQISDFLKLILDQDAIDAWPKTAKTAQLKTDRNILRQMSYQLPYPASRALACLMVFNRADKYLSTYGETLITKQHLSTDGRIHGRLNIAQAITGRFSSSNPNLQNIPRAPYVRRSFIAGTGRRLILADYSGVEIRVLAEMSGDKILLHDAIYDDVHARSAIAIYKLDADDFLERLKNKDPAAKEMRAKAKGFTFQLLYGAGAAALAIVLRCSVAEAEDAIRAWSDRYKKAYDYRRYVFEKMNHSGFIDCKSGRTIYVRRPDRTMPVAANYGIQGSAGDVMYAALARCYERLQSEEIDAWMMVTVHDELLLLADDDEENCQRAKVLLEEAMVQGWLDIFENTNTDNLVDAAIGIDWSDKE